MIFSHFRRASPTAKVNLLLVLASPLKGTCPGDSNGLSPIYLDGRQYYRKRQPRRLQSLSGTKSKTFMLRSVLHQFSGPDPDPIGSHRGASGQTSIDPVPFP